MRLNLALVLKWLGISAVVLLSGCEGGTIMPQLCSGPGDCPPGYQCSAGSCQPVAETAPLPGDAGSGDWPLLSDSGLCKNGGVPCAKTCCAKEDVCIFGTCTGKQPPCVGDKDCINDTYCYKGQCVPWGSGPKGTFNKSCSSVVPIGQFSHVSLSSSQLFAPFPTLSQLSLTFPSFS